MTPNKLKDEIMKSRAPKQWEFLLSEILANPKLFDTVLNFAFSADKVLSFRASWIMDKSAEEYPQLLTQKYLDKISSEVIQHPNFSVIRACLRLLSREKLISKNLGQLTNQCFSWLAASNTPIAVKAHSMLLLYRVALIEPDLKNELKVTIEDQLTYGSAGFKSRGKKILKLLDKNIPDCGSYTNQYN